MAGINGNKGGQKEAHSGLWGERSGKLAIEVEDDALEVGFIEDFFVFGGAEEEGGRHC